MAGVTYWAGKRLEECTKEELLEAIEWMHSPQAFEYEMHQMRDSTECRRLREENARLWQALGVRNAP